MSDHPARPLPAPAVGSPGWIAAIRDELCANPVWPFGSRGHPHESRLRIGPGCGCGFRFVPCGGGYRIMRKPILK